MSTYHGTTCKLKIERLAAEGQIAKEYLGILSGGDVDQDFYTKNFPITWDAGEAGGVAAAVAANAPTDTVFKTTLPSAANNYYNGMTIRFTSGALAAANEMRVISAYVGATKQVTVAVAFSVAPNIADTFIVEPSVDVYTDDGTLGSWTEYDEDGTDYTIAGLTGKVTILADENQVDNAGERISISYYTTAFVGRGQNVTVDQDSELTDIHELGSRIPVELKEGKITVGGSIGQLYASRDLAGKFLGVSDFYQRLADFSFYLYPNGETPGQPQIKLSNVKFSGGSWGVAVDSILRLDVRFKGLAVEVDTVP